VIEEMGGLKKIAALIFIAAVLAACGNKDEDKAAENRPPIPGY
jgi:hypothetical protein